MAGIALAFVAWGTLPLLLPATWFPGATWRTALTEDLGIALGPTLSPQPWLTADALVLFCAGLAWLWWAAESARDLPNRGRRAAARWFVLGAAALAVTALVCQRLGVQPPGWRQERGLGPFPNRNQFGNFLALAALLALGGVARGCPRGASVVGGSARFGAGGPGGGGIRELLPGGRRHALRGDGGLRRARCAGCAPRCPSGASRPPRLAVAASVLALLLAGFFLVGGDTLARFTGGGVRDAAGAVAGDFRWRSRRTRSG